MKGKRMAVVLGAVGMAVTAGAAAAFKDRAALEWYSWKLESTDEGERRMAIVNLGAMRSERAVARLLRLVPRAISDSYSGEFECLFDAITNSGRIGAPAIRGLMADKDLRIRYWTLEMLWSMDSSLEDLPWLIAALSDDSPEFFGSVCRSLAAYLIGKLGPDAKEAVPVLIKRLKGQNRGTRQQVAKALGAVGPDAKEAISFLVEATRDEDNLVREEAEAALKKIRGEEP